MKLTLANNKVYNAVVIEESYYPRNTQGVVLNIRMNSDENIESLMETFVPESLSTITVGEGEDMKTITGYIHVDSIRKLYDDNSDTYNTVVDLVKTSEL